MDRKPLTTNTFVVLGDGLAAGAGDFGLHEQLQPFSYPAQFAAQIGAPFSQPLMQAPGVGPVIGFADLPVRLPQAMQTTVLREFPPSGPFSNLSIPGFKVNDALTRRPVSPLVHRSDGLQTSVNLILGLPGLAMGGTQPLPTQLEYAMFRQPTLALIALGLSDVLEAVYAADPAWLPDEVSFRLDYTRLVQPLRSIGADVIVATIPDPLDMPCLSRLESAADVLKVEPAVLSMLFGLASKDRVTPAGLVEMGCRMMTRSREPLPRGSVVDGATADAIAARVRGLNAQLAALARDEEALLFDLHAVTRGVAEVGVAIGGRRLTADYLGGFYSLNGVYPGSTGHGVITNALIDAVNAARGTSYLKTELIALAPADPVVDFRPAGGPALTMAEFAALASAPPPPLPPREAPRSAEPGPAIAASEAESIPGGRRLPLPPGLEQVLPIDHESSYFGDALRAVHTREERDVMYGSTPNLLFGGPCLVQSHLRGSIRIKFSEPVGDTTHFEVSLEGGLDGDDGLLTAPQFFRLPAIMNKVTDVPGLLSSGDLDLATGAVANLTVSATFMNSALMALVSVNPKIPPTPITFPGQYGSAYARFEPRADGKLDFSFSGVTFLPLGAGFGGEPTRFPLPFAGPAMKFASIPSVGTALHPHLRISTKAPLAAPAGAEVPELPTNTIREFTAFTHNSAFGDKFSLNIPELGGPAIGRSHLLGRVLVQFGARSGNSIPLAVSTLAPGGMLVAPPESEMAKMFPGRLSLGLLGHDEVLRFPGAQYSMHGVCFVDDPFEFSIGSIDVATGRVLGDLLFRGFIVQDMLMALIRLEPRTPKSTFHFRGPAAFERDVNGQIVFGFSGSVRIPYPEGFGFPRPDLQTTFTVGAGSALDPYLYIQAMAGEAPAPAGKGGRAEGVVASNGERFSYSYEIPGYPAGKAASFEYSNHTTGGAFRMTSLLWVSFMNSSHPAREAMPQVVSFTGLGFWSKDTQPQPHIATVQISTAPELSYVSILIDGGMVSNVNTKPATAVMPFADQVLA